ncbi:MAG TPA: hypothetical protein VG984_00305 [Candidatus Paceibacterota bacterium]|nr:hypothetical protein [Candidatus Paceibacterota bacterium]
MANAGNMPLGLGPVVNKPRWLRASEQDLQDPRYTRQTRDVGPVRPGVTDVEPETVDMGLAQVVNRDDAAHHPDPAPAPAPQQRQADPNPQGNGPNLGRKVVATAAIAAAIAAVVLGLFWWAPWSSSTQVVAPAAAPTTAAPATPPAPPGPTATPVPLPPPGPASNGGFNRKFEDIK